MAVGSDPQVGTSLAGYRLDERIGDGGMGVVYRAHDAALDRSVAVKLVAPRLSGDRAFRDRFLVEARLAASLDHPNVVPVHDAGEIDGQLYLAMRFVEGSDLREALAEGPLASERALEVCGQVAAALDAAHKRGLVHRDVKPSNVLLDEDGHAYLADFGLTRRLSEQAPGFDAGLSLGTPAYVAPEQIESAGGESAVVGPRADQYSLACMLYACLAGEPPFSRASEAATLFAHLVEEPPTLPRLERVLARGLAKDPADRFESCTALVEAARDALPQTRRRSRPIAVAVAVLVAAGAVAAVVFTGGDEPRIGHDWTRVPHNEAAFGSTQKTAPVGISVGDSGLIAIGTSGVWEKGGDSDLTIWTSPDGLDWTLVRDESLDEPGWQFPDDVIAAPSGYIVVGSEAQAGDLSRDTVNLDAAVWRSDDGATWVQLPHDEDTFGDSHMFDIVAGGPGFVVVGSDEGILQPGVWTSPDGEQWSRVPADPRIFGARQLTNGYPVMFAAAVGEDGRIVAVGGELATEPVDGGYPAVGAAWTSTDGLSWTRAPHDDDAFGDGSTWVDIDTVAAGSAGFVAAAVEGSEALLQFVLADKGPEETRTRILVSADGLTWTAVPAEQLPGGGEGSNITAVIRGGPGFVAVGWRRNNPGVADADIDPVVWVSPDGEHWTEAADPQGVFSEPGGQLIEQVIVTNSGLVAIGQDGGVKGFNTAVWTSP